MGGARDARSLDVFSLLPNLRSFLLDEKGGCVKIDGWTAKFFLLFILSCLFASSSSFSILVYDTLLMEGWMSDRIAGLPLLYLFCRITCRYFGSSLA